MSKSEKTSSLDDELKGSLNESEEWFLLTKNQVVHQTKEGSTIITDEWKQIAEQVRKYELLLFFPPYWIGLHQSNIIPYGVLRIMGSPTQAFFKVQCPLTLTDPDKEGIQTIQANGIQALVNLITDGESSQSEDQQAQIKTFYEQLVKAQKTNHDSEDEVTAGNYVFSMIATSNDVVVFPLIKQLCLFFLEHGAEIVNNKANFHYSEPIDWNTQLEKLKQFYKPIATPATATPSKIEWENNELDFTFVSSTHYSTLHWQKYAFLNVLSSDSMFMDGTEPTYEYYYGKWLDQLKKDFERMSFDVDGFDLANLLHPNEQPSSPSYTNESALLRMLTSFLFNNNNNSHNTTLSSVIETSMSLLFCMNQQIYSTFDRLIRPAIMGDDISPTIQVGVHKYLKEIRLLQNRLLQNKLQTNPYLGTNATNWTTYFFEKFPQNINSDWHLDTSKQKLTILALYPIFDTDRYTSITFHLTDAFWTELFRITQHSQVDDEQKKTISELLLVQPTHDISALTTSVLTALGRATFGLHTEGTLSELIQLLLTVVCLDQPVNTLGSSFQVEYAGFYATRLTIDLTSKEKVHYTTTIDLTSKENVHYTTYCIRNENERDTQAIDGFFRFLRDDPTPNEEEDNSQNEAEMKGPIDKLDNNNKNTFLSKFGFGLGSMWNRIRNLATPKSTIPNAQPNAQPNETEKKDDAGSSFIGQDLVRKVSNLPAEYTIPAITAGLTVAPFLVSVAGGGGNNNKKGVLEPPPPIRLRFHNPSSWKNTWVRQWKTRNHKKLPLPGKTTSSPHEKTRKKHWEKTFRKNRNS